MEEEGADDVSRPEKTWYLWLKPLLPLQPSLPPLKQEIRAKEEVPFGNINRFLIHWGQGSTGELPAVNTYLYFRPTSHARTCPLNKRAFVIFCHSSFSLSSCWMFDFSIILSN